MNTLIKNLFRNILRKFKMADVQMFNQSADRNKQPILEVLKTVFAEEKSYSKKVLEISSGSGQHVVHFAEYFTEWNWQPSDCDDKYIASITSYIEEKKFANVNQPLFIDVMSDSISWDDGKMMDNIDVMLNINMIHITPVECTYGLFNAAGNVLKPGGRLVTYGPYAVDGVLTPESNVAFDENLKSRNSAWGIKDVRLLEGLGNKVGLKLEKMFDMPANNKCLIFTKLI